MFKLITNLIMNQAQTILTLSPSSRIHHGYRQMRLSRLNCRLIRSYRWSVFKLLQILSIIPFWHRWVEGWSLRRSIISIKLIIFFLYLRAYFLIFIINLLWYHDFDYLYLVLILFENEVHLVRTEEPVELIVLS